MCGFKAFDCPSFWCKRWIQERSKKFQTRSRNFTITLLFWSDDSVYHSLPSISIHKPLSFNGVIWCQAQLIFHVDFETLALAEGAKARQREVEKKYLTQDGACVPWREAVFGCQDRCVSVGTEGAVDIFDIILEFTFLLDFDPNMWIQIFESCVWYSYLLKIIVQYLFHLFLYHYHYQSDNLSIWEVVRYIWDVLSYLLNLENLSCGFP